MNPNDDWAHNCLGIALGGKGDLDGQIFEAREALRLNPNNAVAHLSLGVAFENRGDLRGALEEYRRAYMLDPKNPDYKQYYEGMLQQVNQ